MYNVQTRGITTANVVVGMALFVGGLAQFVAGMWEFACQNTFGATGERRSPALPPFSLPSPPRFFPFHSLHTPALLLDSPIYEVLTQTLPLHAAFTMFGGFWMSFGTIFIPGSGVLDAYVTNGVLDAAELNSALGIYLWTWFMITFFLFIGSLRKNIGLIALFLFLTTTFGLLGAGKFSKDNSVALTKGGGALGIITAMIAFYVGLAELLSDRSSSWFVLPLGQIPKGRID
uniref:Transcriptional repressor rco-1 n=1 Tax=Ganoderma boninense TaxID=34458 RepID=A0A5K1JXR1_9APHY|nr:Transcriptional repressor rco-1 [Ganoderma boninense]